MDHFKDLDPIFNVNLRHELNQCTEHNFQYGKTMQVVGNASEEFMHKKLWDLHNQQAMTTASSQKKIENSQDDLISFTDDVANSLIVVDDTAEQSIKFPEPDTVLQPATPQNFKYYNDLLTVFDNAYANDTNDCSAEKITLGKVTVLKNVNTNSSTDCTENSTKKISLGTVTSMQNTNTICLDTKCSKQNITTIRASDNLQHPSKLTKKSVDLVDLFKNISVKTKDIHNQTSKDCEVFITSNNKSHILEKKDQLLVTSPSQEDVNKITQEKNEIDTLLQNVDSRITILATKDDQLFQILGNNVTIKCDRNYVISPGVHANSGIMCKCHERTDEKVLFKNVPAETMTPTSKKLFANISYDSKEKATEILKNSTKVIVKTLGLKPEDLFEDQKITEARAAIAEANKIKSLDSIAKKSKSSEAINPLIDYDEIQKPWYSKQDPPKGHIQDMPKSVSATHNPVHSLTISKEMPKGILQSKNVSKTLHTDVKNMTDLGKFEVLEENRALRRVLWQKKRAAIDEFIHGGKFIKGASDK